MITVIGLCVVCFLLGCLIGSYRSDKDHIATLKELQSVFDGNIKALETNNKVLTAVAKYLSEHPQPKPDGKK